MIWADGLDVPLIETLQVVSVERRPQERLRVKKATSTLRYTACSARRAQAEII